MSSRRIYSNIYSSLAILIELQVLEGFIFGCKGEKQPKMREIGGFKIQNVQKFKYLGILMADDGGCNKEIRNFLGIAKDSFQKLNNILINRMISSEAKK